MPEQVHSGVIASVINYLSSNLDTLSVASGSQTGADSTALTGVLSAKQTTTTQTGTSFTETVLFSEGEGTGAIRSIGLSGAAGLISVDAAINKNASQSLTVSVTVQVNQV